ncbi:hypothetical protein C8Q74DRAFT_1215621 [Fomes fomentarius]|nr:hypothetical protein C8Q74DRAFT_1215621 [Fomes fomentarius]
MNLPNSYSQYMALREHQERAKAPLGGSEYAVQESSTPLLSESDIPGLRGSPRPVWQVDSIQNRLAGTSVVLPYACGPQIFANPSNGIDHSAEYGTHRRDVDLFRLSVPHATPFSSYTSHPSDILAPQQAAPKFAVLHAPPIPIKQTVVLTLGTPKLAVPLSYNLKAQTLVPNQTPVLSPAYPIATSSASSSTVHTSLTGRSSTLRAHMHTARTHKG